MLSNSKFDLFSFHFSVHLGDASNEKESVGIATWETLKSTMSQSNKLQRQPDYQGRSAEGYLQPRGAISSRSQSK